MRRAPFPTRDSNALVPASAAAKGCSIDPEDGLRFERAAELTLFLPFRDVWDAIWQCFRARRSRSIELSFVFPVNLAGSTRIGRPVVKRLSPIERRYYHKALESDQSHIGPALLLIAQLYRVEKRARPMAAEDRLELRRRESRPLLNKVHDYLLEIEAELLPRSPEGRAVRYTLKNWTALTRYCEDGDLEIDNNATERVIRSVVASCQRAGVDPFLWLKDVLSLIE
jgi:hypothetical protein